MDETDRTISSLADRERTSDPETVYDDPDSLPEWWREAVHEFESYGLRPYRPSRLSDGEIARDVVESLEDRYDVTIEFKAKNPEYNGEWSIFVDGTPVAQVEHTRKPDGYTVYGISTEALEETVENAIESE